MEIDKSFKPKKLLADLSDHQKVENCNVYTSPRCVGSGPSDHQGRHYAGCCRGYSRRLGQDLVVAQSVTAIGGLK